MQVAVIQTTLESLRKSHGLKSTRIDRGERGERTQKGDTYDLRVSLNTQITHEIISEKSISIGRHCLRHSYKAHEGEKYVRPRQSTTNLVLFKFFLFGNNVFPVRM